VLNIKQAQWNLIVFLKYLYETLLVTNILEMLLAEEVVGATGLEPVTPAV
jgi:hypothetical protein